MAWSDGKISANIDRTGSMKTNHMCTELAATATNWTGRAAAEASNVNMSQRRILIGLVTGKILN